MLPRRHSDAKAAEVSLGGLLRGVKALRVRIDPEIVEQRSQLVMQHAKLMRVQEIFTSPR